MSTDEQFWWNWWVNAAVAGGTIAAVVVALFGDWIRARLFKPRLAIELVDQMGVGTPIQLVGPDGDSRMEDGRFYHLRVSNLARWPPASQVQLNLTRIEEPGPDGEFQVRWTGVVPLRWSLQEVKPLQSVIGPPEICDLCSVAKGKWLQVHTLITPHNLLALLQRRNPVVMILTLQARAAEVDSASTRIQISWDGAWADGSAEMAKHLQVKQLNR